MHSSDQNLLEFFSSLTVPFQLIDENGSVVHANQAMLDLLGYRRGDYERRNIGEFFVHADAARELLYCLRAGEAVRGEAAELRCRDGSVKRVSIDASVRREGGSVHARMLVMSNASPDESSQQDHHQEQLRLALEAGGMGTWEWDLRTDRIMWSASLEAMYGIAPGSFPGTFEAFKRFVHPDDVEQVIQVASQVWGKEDSSGSTEYRIIRADGHVRWHEGRGRIFRDADGVPVRMIGASIDITERKRAENAFRFMAEASASLAGLVDYASTLQKIARLAVPVFADWCAVDMLGADGELHRVAVAHVDPVKVELAHELYRRYPPRRDQPGVWNIVHTGKAELVNEITDEMLAASIQDPEYLRILRELGLKSYIGVPLNVRGKTLGVIVFIVAESGYRYDAADLALAEDLANRASIALENSCLYGEMREADRRKDEFLATLAHELRNPLAPLSSSLQVMRLAAHNPAVRDKSLGIMERQVRHMVRLVDDLLDLARINTGKLELRKERVELNSVVRHALETSQPLIDASRHELIVSLLDEPVFFDADLMRLAQVISNVINNACKYTDPGGKIWLSAELQGSDVVVRVRDSGIGISPDMMPRIFDMFIQEKGGRSGLGVGLSLAKRIVEMHGGRIEARSDGLEKGSEFIIRLSVAAAMPEESRASVLAGMQENGASSRRILVVDDNVDAAASLAMLLWALGEDVEISHDGFSALEKMRDFVPDIVFLDIGMPGLDGYGVARRIRSEDFRKPVTLIAVTGWGQEDDKRRSREAGFDHHLVKPVEFDVLRAILDQS